jgi:hypothetical protein
MQLDNKFKMVLEYLETPNPNHHAGDKQITYLTFDPSETIEVKRRLPSWLSLVRGFDYTCGVISMASVINDFFRSNPRRNSWVIPDGNNTFDEIVEFYKVDLGSMVGGENTIIEKAIISEQEKIKSLPKPLLIVSDLEAIHPFCSGFGPIEQKIYSKIEIPIIILYPGTLSGSSLEFFGFYPPNGNYRSKHF